MQGDVAVDGRARAVLEADVHVADVSGDVDLPRHHPRHLDAAGDLRLAVVQLAGERVDHQRVLRKGDAAVHIAGDDGQAAQASATVFHADVPQHHGVLCGAAHRGLDQIGAGGDRKSTRLNSSHSSISYAV